MTYREENRDLFTVSDDYYLAHCISADFKLGAGIAVEFDKRFNMRYELFYEFPDGYIDIMDKYHLEGECILIGKVLNIITKKRYYQKPSLSSMKEALSMTKEVCVGNNISKIAMPKIGCGLDKLHWEDVSALIKETFMDTNVEILVCYQ